MSKLLNLQKLLNSLLFLQLVTNTFLIINIKPEVIPEYIENNIKDLDVYDFQEYPEN